MKEAFRLLNKSIIRVEQPVINFDEEEDEVLGEFFLNYNIAKKGTLLPLQCYFGMKSNIHTSLVYNICEMD